MPVIAALRMRGSASAEEAAHAAHRLVAADGAEGVDGRRAHRRGRRPRSGGRPSWRSASSAGARSTRAPPPAPPASGCVSSVSTAVSSSTLLEVGQQRQRVEHLALRRSLASARSQHLVGRAVDAPGAAPTRGRAAGCFRLSCSERDVLGAQAHHHREPAAAQHEREPRQAVRVAAAERAVAGQHEARQADGHRLHHAVDEGLGRHPRLGRHRQVEDLGGGVVDDVAEERVGALGHRRRPQRGEERQRGVAEQQRRPGSTASEPITPARLSRRLVPNSCRPSASTPTPALK